MNLSARRALTWLVLLLGLSVAARLVSQTWPRENHLRLTLSRSVVADRVALEIVDLDGETWRSAELHPAAQNPTALEYTVSLPPADYQIRLQYRVRSIGYVDKNHGGGWTTLVIQHQIRLDGGDYRFPPPDDEAQ